MNCSKIIQPRPYGRGWIILEQFMFQLDCLLPRIQDEVQHSLHNPRYDNLHNSDKAVARMHHT